MSKHTPGPWRPVGRDGALLTKPWNGWTIEGRDGRSVAACGANVTRTDREKFANALLMAAAPEMLAALKLVVRAAPTLFSEDEYLTMDWYITAVEAIAIAEGRKVEAHV